MNRKNERRRWNGMSIFDLEDGDFIFGSGDTGFDSDGHMMSRMSDNMALDMDTGEIHMVSSWNEEYI